MTDEPTTTAGALELLRRRRTRTELFGGFGPLIVAAVLLVAMMLLTPSVAPEQIVERRVDETTVTTGAPR